jgi:hypothetical protein
MWLRRSAIVVLIAGFLVASFAADTRAVKNRSKHDPIHVTGATHQRALSPSPSRPFSVSIQSQWRSRLKSVLDETDPRILEESDLGPAPIPIQTILIGCNGPSPCLRLATLQLRC